MHLNDNVIESPKIEQHNDSLVPVYEEAFVLVSGYVSRRGGSFEEARDILHDAMIVFFEKDDLSNCEYPAGYILGIARNLWNRKYRTNDKFMPLDELERECSIPEDFVPTVQDKRLLKVVEMVGRRCLEVLTAFYYRSGSVKDAASQLGYANEHSFSVQKHKCLMRLKQLVKSKAMTHADFIE